MEESTIASKRVHPGQSFTSRTAFPDSTSSTSRQGPIGKRRNIDGIHKDELDRKGQKIMGRPKNSWTPRRLRRLVRLYLMTNLEVAEIAKVLQSTEFKPWLVPIYIERCY